MGKNKKEFSVREIENKWQEFWEKEQAFRFDEKDEARPRYVIDTPPPYPTGRLHMGHTLNWIYMDLIARYKRMTGHNVLFPQGWDCHGLPTEVKVEETHGIKKNDVSKQEFRKLCVELMEKNIEKMRKQLKSLGLAIDWSWEYITMLPKYYSKTQYSFVDMYEKNLLYREEHPVNWCPRCETAIAYAEVEYKDRTTKLNYLKFKTAEGHVEIATTRPELLPACVAIAVNPSDERYKKLIGTRAEVPLFKQHVEILGDDKVDKDFGTGIVMICTFGDKTDVYWAKKYELPIIKAIDEKGKLTKAAQDYAGLSAKEAQEKIICDLEKQGFLIKQEQLPQSVGACWRCKTPIEILPSFQWFIDVKRFKDEIKRAANEIKWFPEHMRLRLLNWADTMEWDWCISRQRIFATPIPVWYCADCDETIVAGKNSLPVNPLVDKCPVEKCPKCGSKNIRPEEDVLDTWMDSSITPLVLAGYPKINEKIFPSTLRPQGHDIIRTWAYYTIARSLMLVGEKPFEEIVINGMVQGEDGRKMSKSLGNFVEPDTILEQYGIDAVRQWAADSNPGSDVPFSGKEVKHGHDFVRKLYNASSFVSRFIQDYSPSETPKNLRPVDEWILSKLNSLVKKSREGFENYSFGNVLTPIRNFFWHDFCDNYIEMVKKRVYSDSPDKEAAVYCLHEVLLSCLKLLAPFVPHITEEVYQSCFREKHKAKTIHHLAYPEPDEKLISPKAEDLGELALEIVSETRRLKNQKQLPMNAEIKLLRITTKDGKKIAPLEQDLSETLKAGKIEVVEEGSELKVEAKF